MKQKILIIEDEKAYTGLIKTALEKGAYKITSSASAEDGLKEIKELKPDLIILDWKLPGWDGIELCRFIRGKEEIRDIPILMLTAMSDVRNKVLGLESGADDYLSKPFEPEELAARVKALLRRVDYTKETQKTLIAENITLDLEKRKVTVNGKPVTLTSKEFDLLYFLIKKRGDVLSRDAICRAVWDYKYFGTTRTVDMTVSRIREKLGKAGKKIETVKDIGYQFTEEAG